MSNMSYCRFENTARALADCVEHVTDNLSGDEADARKQMLELCREFIAAYESEGIGEPGFEGEDECHECGARLPVADLTDGKCDGCMNESDPEFTNEQS